MYNEQSQIRSDRAAKAFLSRAEDLAIEVPEEDQGEDKEVEALAPWDAADQAFDTPEANAIWNACGHAQDLVTASADTRDYGVEIPSEWYQSPTWRKEMMDNLKASMAGDFSWVDQKFAEYEALALANKLEKEANAYKAQGFTFIGCKIMGRAMGLRDDVKNGRIVVKK
jgi:hypothetical protein